MAGGKAWKAIWTQLTIRTTGEAKPLGSGQNRICCTDALAFGPCAHSGWPRGPVHRNRLGFATTNSPATARTPHYVRSRHELSDHPANFKQDTGPSHGGALLAL